MTEQSTAQNTALVQYGDSAEVRTLARRIMAMHPSAKQIGDRGALLLAQLGIALGLNPLPGTGHIHAWTDGNTLCVHIGLEGRMALARKDSAFSQSTRPMNADEVELHGLKPGDRGAVCELFRHDHTKLFASLGLPIKPVVGIGICMANERAPRGRTLYWRASQRAIKDAIRLAYSFSLPGEMLNDINLYENAPDTIIDSEFTLSGEPEAEGASQAQSEPHTPDTREKANADLFGGEANEQEPPDTGAAREPADEEIGSPEAELPQTAKPNQKTATVSNDAAAKWDAFCKSLAERYPHYAAKPGVPNKFHIGALAVKFGVGTVTLDNLPALTGRIERYAKDNYKEKAAF